MRGELGRQLSEILICRFAIIAARLLQCKQLARRAVVWIKPQNLFEKASQFQVVPAGEYLRLCLKRTDKAWFDVKGRAEGRQCLMVLALHRISNAFDGPEPRVF